MATTIAKNKRQFEEVGVTDELSDALEIFVDGTDMRKFNKGFRKLLSSRMLGLLKEGLVEEEELEFWTKMDRLSELLDVLETQYGTD